MVSLNIYDMENNKVDELQVKDTVFDVEPDKGVLHEVVKWQLASRRSGTACTKTRAEVRGGGRKPWRQKGTGRARVGSTRNPVWRHGGVAFGPKPRDYSYALPKKVRKLGLRMALTDKVREDRLRVVRDLKLDEIKTRKMVSVLGTLGVDSAVIVLDGSDRNLELSARNIHGIKVLRKEGLNVYDLLKYEYVIVQEPVIASIEERLG
jgi:large subunit ribosomal protein L4